MEIIVKKNIFSLIKKYDIKDSNGRDVMRLEKQMFSLFGKYKLMDLTENPVCEIRRKLWSLFPKYKIIFNNGEMLEVRKGHNILKREFFVVSRTCEYTINGEVIENNFEIKKGQEVLAKVNKKVINMFKAYDVQVRDIKNVPVVLSIIIAMDIIKYRRLAYLF